jgi:glucosamine-6-phosphate deaminase
MEIIILRDAAAASLSAADNLASLLLKKPSAVLGLATGSTPLALYRELIAKHRSDGLDFSRCTSFNLDEYVGLGPDHPASYRRFMQENLFSEINLPSSRIHIPDGLASDLPSHCHAYEQWIRDAGGIDLQILGIGSDASTFFMPGPPCRAA